LFSSVTDVDLHSKLLSNLHFSKSMQYRGSEGFVASQNFGVFWSLQASPKILHSKVTESLQTGGF
jgi:hypothetical protein